MKLKCKLASVQLLADPDLGILIQLLLQYRTPGHTSQDLGGAAVWVSIPQLGHNSQEAFPTRLTGATLLWVGFF